MKSGFGAALCAAAVFALASAAQTADLDNPIGSDNYGVHEEPSGDDQEAPYAQRREWRSERYYDRSRPSQYYGRPVPEHPHWSRPVFARPGWGYRDECRVIVKERVNRWGERVIGQIQVCDRASLLACGQRRVMRNEEPALAVALGACAIPSGETGA